MKKLIAAITIMAIVLSGCANMTKEQQALLGSGLGALAGAGLGAAIGGKQGAAIGAGAGALVGGLAAYALASDPFTQSANQQAETWKKQVGAQPESIKVSEVVENGESKERIDVQSIALSSSRVVANNRLSSAIKQQLTVAQKEAVKTKGLVAVAYPSDAPKDVLQEIRKIGVSIKQDISLKDGYLVYFARSKKDLAATIES